MKKLITIRPATQNDIAIIIDFQQRLAEETENETLDVKLLTLGVKAVFEDKNKGIYYVAELENKVVGCLISTFEWSDWSNTKVMWIASLYVEKESRGKGVFKQFYSYLKELIQSGNEYKGLRLYVNKSNLHAERVYKKLGMDGGHYHLYEWMKE